MARAGLLALILALTVLAYRPVLDAPFVYEDVESVSGAGGFQRAVGTGRWLPSRVLTDWTFGVTRDVFWLEPQAYHAGNLAVHLVNGGLVMALGSMVVSPAVGLAAAAAFLWLPLNSEAVSYVSARSDLLLTLCALIAVLSALKGGWWWPMAVLALVGAAMSKELGVIALPLVLLTRLVLRPVSFDHAHLWIIGAMVLVLGAMYLEPLLSAWMSAPPQGWLVTLGVLHTHFWFLLSMVAWPAWLSIDHDVWSLGWQWDGLAVMGTGAALWAASVPRHLPLVTWGVGWVALSVLPRFVFPSAEWLHEQHLYLATVPISLGLGWLAMRLVAREDSVRIPSAVSA